MAFEDLYGLPISTSSDSAAGAYRRGIELVLSAWPGGSEALELAIEADPDFALAHAARSRMHLIYGEMPSAQKEAADARKLVARKAEGELGRLRLTVDAKSYDIVGAEIVDPLGNVTRLRFSDLRRNTGIDDAQFKFIVPPGVDVIEAPIGN